MVFLVKSFCVCHYFKSKHGQITNRFGPSNYYFHSQSSNWIDSKMDHFYSIKYWIKPNILLNLDWFICSNLIFNPLGSVYLFKTEIIFYLDHFRSLLDANWYILVKIYLHRSNINLSPIIQFNKNWIIFNSKSQNSK